MHTAGKASIGLPPYFWLTEANTAVAATCYTEPWRCSTTFAGPMNMGASFNRTSWELKGGVLGTEMRAFNNLAWHRQNRGDLVGLTGFGPNINIARVSALLVAAPVASPLRIAVRVCVEEREKARARERER